VPAGTPVASKGKSWLCPQCQPWIRRTLADVLADAAAAGDQASATAHGEGGQRAAIPVPAGHGHGQQ
jgi:hypothetical protein